MRNQQVGVGAAEDKSLYFLSPLRGGSSVTLEDNCEVTNTLICGRIDWVPYPPLLAWEIALVALEFLGIVGWSCAQADPTRILYATYIEPPCSAYFPTIFLSFIVGFSKGYCRFTVLPCWYLAVVRAFRGTETPTSHVHHWRPPPVAKGHRRRPRHPDHSAPSHSARR